MKAKRDVSAKSKLNDPTIPLHSAEPAPLLSVRLVHAIYVASIALATLGWLWLIARMVAS
jgi:hypothetical protein